MKHKHLYFSTPSQEFDFLYQQLTELESFGKFDEALSMAEVWLVKNDAFLRERPLIKEKAALIMLVLRLAHQLARPGKVLETGNKYLDPLLRLDPTLAFEALKMISYAYYRQGETEACLQKLDEAEKVISQIPSKDQDTYQTTVQLQRALTYRLISNPEKALEISSTALEAYLNISYPNPVVLAEAYRVYGWSLLSVSIKNVDQARIALENAVQLTASADYFGTPKDQGEIFYTYGVFLYQSREYKKSVKYLEMALNVMEKGCGSDSVELCNTLNQLGAAYEKLDDTQKAGKAYANSYRIRKNAYGEENLLTSISLENLLGTEIKGIREKKEDNYERWNKAYEKLHTVRKNLYDRDPHSNAFWLAQAKHSWACWRLEAGKATSDFDKTLMLFQEALQLYQQGNRIGNSAVCIKNIGRLFEKNGQVDKAMERYQEARPLLLSSFGPTHPAVKEIERLIACL